MSDTPYYHVTSRCVRRAFLCGIDKVSGTSYEHRRAWVEDRIAVLASVFSLQVCAYAVMSNHYHLVVRLNPSESEGWEDDEVLRRWTTLFKGPLLIQKAVAGETLSPAEQVSVEAMTRVYRQRLGCLSWFMKCLNEPIARQANEEDECTGHFWESRFHSQALLNERALLTAMAYVDLNPIRAGAAKTPERSRYTSIHARIAGKAAANRNARNRLQGRQPPPHRRYPIPPLMRFSDTSSRSGSDEPVLPMNEPDYLSLVDQTGRIVVQGKRGSIDTRLLPVLYRLGLTGEQWLSGATDFEAIYRAGDLKLDKTA